MDLANFADLADLAAALGVIASLIYVGYQVKETRKAVRAATVRTPGHPYGLATIEQADQFITRR